MSSDISGMVSTHFKLFMLELGFRVGEWKVYKNCTGSEALHEDWH